jgi:protein-L-isoaspartate(D-aspartate) O-methyltransferase
MAWRCTGATNAELIANLRRASLIKSATVADAMARVDRAHYAPRAPYDDSPQQIGFAATISAPHMHAAACESLLGFLVKKGPGGEGSDERRVLDVGCGSGYLTHVLAECQGEGEGKVVGIDHIQGLVDMSRRNMMKSERGRELLESQRVELVCGDGRKGYAALAPYDAIHVGAAAKVLHEELVEQLKSPGRMFIPVDDGVGGGQWIWVVDKDENGKVKKRKDMGVRYVPLTDTPT